MADRADTAVEEAHGELSLARVALAEDDLGHAASHLAGALAFAPGLPEAHELLAVLAARAGDDGLALFPLHEPAFIGTVVAHAHLLARTEPAQALALLARATAAVPERSWADVSWVRALDPGTVPAAALAQVFTTVMRPLGDPAGSSVRTANEVYLDLARRAVAAHPADAMIHATAAGIGRRLGATRPAVAWGRRAVELQPSKITLVWYAYALRADGRDNDGIAVLRDAYRRFPTELDLCADLANWLAAAGQDDEAVALLEDAVARDPSYDCVVHTLHSLRFERDGDARHLIALADYTRDHPPTGHDHHELDICSRGRPWLGLPPPSSPPSSPATPSSPSTPLPSGEAVELARQVVTPVWAHPIAVYDQALPLGQLPIAELKALATHPPTAPAELSELPPDWWERSVQVFACLGMLHSAEPGRAHPTDTTAHRRILTELAVGADGRTTEAALFALVVAAWVDPAVRPEVAATVAGRFLTAVRETREGAAVPMLDSLAELVLVTPGPDDKARALAQIVLAAAEPAAEPVKRSWLRRLFRRR